MNIPSLSNARRVRVLAGIPAGNMNLFDRCQFLVGDPAVWVEWQANEVACESLFLLRDIEMERASKQARATHVACPAQYAPPEGLSGDRETATAQALAECLNQHKIHEVYSDRSLPLIFHEALQQASIRVHYDPQMGVMDRRIKSQEAMDSLAHAQKITESTMLKACQTICRASADSNGVLWHEGEILSSERLRAMIDYWLLKDGFSNPGSIVACGQQGADCHAMGKGPLHTEQPVSVDIFPRSKESLYNGDCTRTAVHGIIPDEVNAAYGAVVAAKKAAMDCTREGVTGQQVHEATLKALEELGYHSGLDYQKAHNDQWVMVHGTGHGIGLEVHEPPLLDFKGPALQQHEVLTIEPGLYNLQSGGVRSEDMVLVQAEDCLNLNHLPDILNW